MNRLPQCIAVVLAGLAGWAAPTRADEAQQAFDLLYAKDLQRVRTTPERDDDVALARQMLTAARAATGQPAFLALLCRNAYGLTSTHAGGYATAIEAMGILAGADPAQKADCLAKTLDLRQRAFNAARGDARIAAARPLIECLSDLADESVKANDYPAAIGYVRRASSIATAIRSEDKDRLQQRLKLLAAQERTAGIIGTLVQKVQADPKDTTSRERLIRLYLLERDDPAAAAKLLTDECSQALRTYVPMAVQDPESLEDNACLELGDWYNSLLEGASADGRIVALRRVKAYYAAFLAKHATSDLSRTRAQIALEKVTDELAKLSPSQSGTAGLGSMTKRAPGDPLSPMALVSKPGEIAGVSSWTVETRHRRGALRCVALSAKAPLAAVGGQCGTIRILDTATGALVRILIGHTGTIRDLEFSPDGLTLASGSQDRTIRLWNVETGKLQATMTGHQGPVASISWSPDGTALASGGSDTMLGLWKAQSGRRAAMLQTGGKIRQVLWAPNGKVVVTSITSYSAGTSSSGYPSRFTMSRFGAVSLWVANTGQRLKKLPGFEGGPAAAWSPDSTFLAKPGGVGKLELHNLRTGGDPRAIKRLAVPVADLAWSPDGALLAVNHRRDPETVDPREPDRTKQLPSGEIVLLNTKNWQLVSQIKAGDNLNFSDMAWAGEGKSLAAVTSDGRLRLLDPRTGKDVRDLESTQPPAFQAAAVSADAAVTACGTSKAVWIWDTAAGRLRTIVEGFENPYGMEALAFSPDGRILAAGAPDGLQLLDANSGELATTITPTRMARIGAASWSPDGGVLAYSSGLTVRTVTAGTWQEALRLRRDGAVSSYGAVGALAFSGDGKFLAAGKGASKYTSGVDLWTLPSGTFVRKLDQEQTRAMSVAWRPGAAALLAAGTRTGMIQLWDTRGGRLHKTVEVGANLQVRALAWSPDGRTLAAGGPTFVGAKYKRTNEWDRPVSVRLLDPDGGRAPEALPGHIAGIHGLAWTTDGKTLVSAGRRLVRFWDAQTKRPRLTLLATGASTGLAVSAEGHFQASEGLDPQAQLVYVVETARGQETFTPGDFANRYGWKNDPKKVGLAGPPASE